MDGSKSLDLAHMYWSFWYHYRCGIWHWASQQHTSWFFLIHAFVVIGPIAHEMLLAVSLDLIISSRLFVPLLQFPITACGITRARIKREFCKCPKHQNRSDYWWQLHRNDQYWHAWDQVIAILELFIVRSLQNVDSECRHRLEDAERVEHILYDCMFSSSKSEQSLIVWTVLRNWYQFRPLPVRRQENPEEHCQLPVLAAWMISAQSI